MSLLSLTSLSVAMLVLASSPGPGVFATVARSLASGFRPALHVVIGIVLGDIIYLIFAIWGLSLVAQKMGALFFIVRLCGGAYLIWLGIKIWISNPKDTEIQHFNKTHSRLGNIISGLLITLSNPKVIIFYCGFLPTFIDLTRLNLIDTALIVCVVIIVLSTVLTAYAYLANHARKLFSSHIAIKRINRSAGVVMMATGVTIASR